MSRKLVVITLVLGLLVGIIGPIPAASGANPSHILPIVWMRGGGVYMVDGIGVSSDVAGGLTSNGYGGGGPVISVDGTAAYSGEFLSYRTDPSSYLTETVCGVGVIPPTAMIGDGLFHTVSWTSGTTSGGEYHSHPVTGGSYQVRFPAALIDTWTEAGAFGMLGPLSVSVTGEANPAVGTHYTYTATITGGSSPFTTQWVVSDQTDRVIYTGAVGTSTTLSYAFAAVATYEVTCTATDSLGTAAIGSFTVHLALNKPELWAQVMSFGGVWFSVYLASVPHTTLPVSRSLAVLTAHYNVVDPDTSTQTENEYKLAVSNPPPNPLVVTVLYVDPATGVGWHYTFSFDTSNWADGSASGSDGSQTTQTPLPEWLQAVYDMFVRLFKYLFDPGASTAAEQLSQGWVTIASPVPSVVPQYTIPFPNPRHLLAPTGASVNIDFSVIQTYTGYSTVKTIIQVVLDAILVFVVISIVA